MRRQLIAFLIATAVLSACSEATLSKRDQEVLDAMMFLFSGIEDNTNDGGLMPWQRKVQGQSIEFWKVQTTEGIGYSDPEMNRKLRQSAYLRHVERISQKEPCVFYFEGVTEFSNGNSQTDFSAYSERSVGSTKIFNLANAHVFNLNVKDAKEIGKVTIQMAGPRVYCPDYGDCENSWLDFFGGMDQGRFHYTEFETSRRLKAIELIKKICPGKPY